MSGFSDALRFVISDPEVAQAYRSGLLELENLNDLDRLRLTTTINELVLNFKDSLAAYDAKMFDKPTCEESAPFYLHAQPYFLHPKKMLSKAAISPARLFAASAAS